MATTPRHIVRPQRVHGVYVLDTVTGDIRAGLTTPGARQVADRLNRATLTTEATHPITGAALTATGHKRIPGTFRSYCGRDLDKYPNTGRAARVCTPCVKAEARDRADAATVAEQHREDATAEPAAAATWRSDWIGATDTAPTLFALPAPDQGALFA